MQARRDAAMSVPQEAIDAAMAAADLYVASRPHPDPIGIAGAAVEAAAPLIAAAERDRIYALLGSDHYVIFTEDRWTIEHTVECRLSGHMHECGYHTAVSLIAAEFDPAMAGRWRIDGIGSDGLPDMVRADGPPA
jgi:hypothetical protein